MPDVWDSAYDATQGPRVYFGQIFTDGHYVYISFRKGEPRVLFDPSQHPIDGRHTLVKIDGVCTKRDGTTYEIPREMVCELDDAWQITKVSLKVTGVHPRDLNERWAKWEMVETGDTWNSKTTGELVKGTTFKFLEFYSDEAACKAAETAHYSRPTPIPTEDSSALDKSHPMPEEAVAPANDAQREVAAKFLPALWKSAGGDVTKFSELIAGNPLTSKFFDLNSAEVAAIVAEAVTA
jgi:hypothetical protein